MCCGSTPSSSPAPPEKWACCSGQVGANGRSLAYDSGTGVLSLDRTASGNTDFHESFASVERVAVPLEDGRLRLRIFLDRCSVEVFAQDGLATITDQVFAAESSARLGLFADRDGARLVSLDIVAGA